MQTEVPLQAPLQKSGNKQRDKALEAARKLALEFRYDIRDVLSGSAKEKTLVFRNQEERNNCSRKLRELVEPYGFLTYIGKNEAGNLDARALRIENSFFSASKGQTEILLIFQNELPILNEMWRPFWDVVTAKAGSDYIYFHEYAKKDFEKTRKSLEKHADKFRAIGVEFEYHSTHIPNIVAKNKYYVAPKPGLSGMKITPVEREIVRGIDIGAVLDEMKTIGFNDYSVRVVENLLRGNSDAVNFVEMPKGNSFEGYVILCGKLAKLVNPAGIDVDLETLRDIQYFGDVVNLRDLFHYPDARNKKFLELASGKIDLDTNWDYIGIYNVVLSKWASSDIDFTEGNKAQKAKEKIESALLQSGIGNVTLGISKVGENHVLHIENAQLVAPVQKPIEHKPVVTTEHKPVMPAPAQPTKREELSESDLRLAFLEESTERYKQIEAVEAELKQRADAGIVKCDDFGAKNPQDYGAVLFGKLNKAEFLIYVEHENAESWVGFNQVLLTRYGFKISVEQVKPNTTIHNLKIENMLYGASTNRMDFYKSLFKYSGIDGKGQTMEQFWDTMTGKQREITIKFGIEKEACTKEYNYIKGAAAYYGIEDIFCSISETLDERTGWRTYSLVIRNKGVYGEGYEQVDEFEIIRSKQKKKESAQVPIPAFSDSQDKREFELLQADPKYKKYAPLGPLYGAEFVKGVVDSAKTEGIDPLPVFYILTAEHTSSSLGAKGELMRFASQMRADPSCKNSLIGDWEYKEQAYYLPQMRQSTFRQLGLPFAFDEMEYDWKKGVRAAARYCSMNSKMVEKYLLRDDSDYFVALAVAHNGPGALEKTLQVARKGNKNWELTHQTRNGSTDAMAGYVQKVDRFDYYLQGLLDGSLAIKRAPGGNLVLSE